MVDPAVEKAKQRARLIHGALPLKDCAARRDCGNMRCRAPGKPLFRRNSAFMRCGATTPTDISVCVRDLLLTQGIDVAKKQ